MTKLDEKRVLMTNQPAVPFVTVKLGRQQTSMITLALREKAAIMSSHTSTEAVEYVADMRDLADSLDAQWGDLVMTSESLCRDYTPTELGNLLIGIGTEMVMHGVGAPAVGDSIESCDRVVETITKGGIDEDTAYLMLAELDLRAVVEYIPGDQP